MINYYNEDVYNDLKRINKNSYFNEWYEIVKPILLSDEFQRRKLFIHHDASVWEHSIDVSFKSFLVGKFYKLDTYTCAVAGLLHDFYPNAWRYSEELEKLDPKYMERYHKNHLKLNELHGFVHGKEAAQNSSVFFPELVNKKILSCIETHMFPLTIKMPRYIEGWVIQMVDKKVSVEIFKCIKDLPLYLGAKEGN